MTMLSKLAWFALAPLNALFALAVLALVLAWAGRRRSARVLGLLVALAVFLGGFTQLPDLLVSSLEGRHTRPALEGRVPHGIIVLGGGMSSVSKRAIGKMGAPYRLNEAGDRAIAGLALKRRLPDARLIVTGKTGSGLPEGASVRAMAADLYTTPPAIEVEGRSRSTRENADRVAAMVGDEKDKDWLLVTSALHMERALWTFRQRGFAVTPWPVDPLAGTIGFPYLRGSITGQFAKLDAATKEIIGLAAYRLLD
ncbi:MAG: YdcF family protein [Pseudomonadota bacterium]